LAGYAAGQSDKFKGTGVWKFVEFEREPESKLEDKVKMDNSKSLDSGSKTLEKTDEKAGALKK
jgi:hypothetical protein